jgi:hypothetical protein
MGSLDRRLAGGRLPSPGQNVCCRRHDRRQPVDAAFRDEILDVRRGDPDRVVDPVVRQLALRDQAVDFPRRYGQHLGGLTNGQEFHVDHASQAQ